MLPFIHGNGKIVGSIKNLAEILTDSIENKKDIDLARAENAKRRAEERLKSNDPNIDFKRAELALKKALNRIEVKNLK